MEKKRLFSGLTSTGRLTLGNYIGSLSKLLKLQEDKNNEVIIFIANLHALTIPITKAELLRNVKENLKLYIAIGIDPKKTKIYLQSQIEKVNELFYILSTMTTIGQLERMTQYKDKATKQANSTFKIPTGILFYPILMAADIILFNPDYVIVGNDQKQHLEFTRDLILKLNNNYDTDIKLVEAKIADLKEGAKIMALKNPKQKMSKSDQNKDNTIYLLDDLLEVKRKILGALTDSENKIYYDLEKKAGVSNLLVIYSTIKNISLKKAEQEFKNLTDYRKFKEIVADQVCNLLAKIQKNYHNLNDDKLIEILNYNLKYLKKEANKNLDKIKDKIGLIL
ncbi:/ trpS / Tryptophan--tRNA ligase /:296299 Forward [Candidatus Hepatoplasma crinochetorum]|uniref:Tryptophan--tRNA ligase n=1 Tax=Candidatus Hepatoplasma crinochetorum TaxID=295596 RepID=A0A0G7ZKZ9_9MOLU|nr:/ trpS / Tryptophan--tRNA ligase /:296299 Forward [Candidatus Hepatoplasma crinochetorum]